MKELFWAARHGRVAEIGEALAAGADIDWRHPVDGRTPLGAAAAFDHQQYLPQHVTRNRILDFQGETWKDKRETERPNKNYARAPGWSNVQY